MSAFPPAFDVGFDEAEAAQSNAYAKHLLEGQALIGCLMGNGEHLGEVAQIVSPMDFASVDQRSLFALMLRRKREQNIDPDETEFFIAAFDLPKSSGLMNEIQHWAIDYYRVKPKQAARALLASSTRRKCFQTCRAAALAAWTSEDPYSVLTATTERLSRLHAPAEEVEPTWNTIIEGCIEGFDDAATRTTPKGLPTGLTELDGYLTLLPGKLYVVAARPGMGKTALALHFMRAAGDDAAPDGRMGRRFASTWGMFSMEMDSRELANRMICAEADVDSGGFARGQVDPSGYGRLDVALRGMKTWDLRICDRSSMSIDQLEIKAKHWALTGLHGVVVDYLQLMTKSNPRISTIDHVSEVTRRLKVLAREMGIPIVLLSQLNRDCEKRQDKRPLLADLRASGSIEQDADAVVMLYRGHVYSDGALPMDVEIIIRKNRSGELGTVQALWQGSRTSFSNCPPKGNS
jgi:replicative DNA helicase